MFVLIKTSSEDEDERRLQEVFIKTNVCWEGYRQVTYDAFTFPKEILKRDTSLFWVLAVSEEMK